MENPIEHLAKSAQEIRLTSEASSRMRERIVAHMKAHPVQTPSPYQRFFILSPFAAHVRKPVAALALLLIVGFGGASTFASANALPGDPLYPVKVSVLEPVQGLFATSPEAKAAWHVSVAETRVNEVEQLASQDKLTPEQGVKSQQNFDQSLHDARDTIEQLSQANPQAAAKIDDAFTASLDAHEATLSTFASTSSSTNAVQAQSFAAHMQTEVHRGDRNKGGDRGGDSQDSSRSSGSRDSGSRGSDPSTGDSGKVEGASIDASSVVVPPVTPVPPVTSTPSATASDSTQTQTQTSGGTSSGSSAGSGSTSDGGSHSGSTQIDGSSGGSGSNGSGSTSGGSTSGSSEGGGGSHD